MNLRQMKSFSKATILTSMMVVLFLFNPVSSRHAGASGGPAFKGGFIAGKGMVLSDAGNPIWVEYTVDGEVRVPDELGEAVGDLNGAIVMSAYRYKAANDAFRLLKESFAGSSDAYVVMDRDEYLSTRFMLADDETVYTNKPPLSSPDTFSVVIRAQHYLFDSNMDLVLLESPIDLKRAQHLSSETQSLLLNKDTRDVIYQSPHNIGYKSAFFSKNGDWEDDSGQMGLYSYDHMTDTLWAPLEGARVYSNLFPMGQDSADENGRFMLKYVIPPCPGFSYTYEHDVVGELAFQTFNPKSRRQFLRYFVSRPVFDFCMGYSEGVIPFGMMEVAAISGLQTQEAHYLGMKAAMDARSLVKLTVDLVMLTGEASLKNEKRFGVGCDDGLLGSIELGETAYGTGIMPEYAPTSPDQYDMVFDFDGDGKADKTRLRKVETQEESEEEPIVNWYLDVWFDEHDPDHDPVDLTRLADYVPDSGTAEKTSADFYDRGLLETISKKDLEDTDTFVFRESNGSLITYREGLSPAETPHVGMVTDEHKARVNYRLKMRGPIPTAPHAESIADWGARSNLNADLCRRHADHLRPGEWVNVVMINRASGYIGSERVQVGLSSGGAGLVNFTPPEIEMRPPNLKIRAERTYMVESGAEQGERENLIGFEGAGLVNDVVIKITTEWVGWDGMPLPKDLRGYTGRVAKVVAADCLEEASDPWLAQFEIRPGIHTQIVKLPRGDNSDVQKAHYYIQVNGEPVDRNPNFSSAADFQTLGAGNGVLQYRPSHYVPVKVAVYDEKATRLAEFARNKLLAEEEPVPEEVRPVYKWVYRPEMQFSLFDGRIVSEEESMETDTSETEAKEQPPYLESQGMWTNFIYSILEDELEMLAGFGDERRFVFDIGGHEVEAVINEEGKTLVTGNLDINKLFSPEDYLTVRLIMNGDDANTLWEYNAVKLKILAENPKGTQCRMMPGQPLTLYAETWPKDTEIVWTVIKEKTDDRVRLESPENLSGRERPTCILRANENTAQGWAVIRATTKKDPSIFTEVAVRVGCPSCTDCDKPGAGFFRLSSVDARISLGLFDGGAPAGDLLIKTDELSPELLTPKTLSVSTLVKGVDQRFDAEGMLRQIVVPQALVDIEPHDDQKGYDIRYYYPSQYKWNQETQLFEPSGEPFTLWRVENPHASAEKMTRLKVTEIRGGVETPYEYVQEKLDGINEKWSLIEAQGEKVTERLEEKLSDIERSITTVVKDKENRIASTQKNLWKKFPWGEEIVESITDPGGMALKRIQQYETNSSSPGYGKLKQVENPEGSWRRYTYDGKGRVMRVASSLLDAGTSSRDTRGKEVVNSYDPVLASDTQSPEDDRRPRTVEERVEGALVSRTLHAYIVDESTRERTEITERCLDPDAAYGAQGNLRTVRVLNPVKIGDITSGLTKKVVFPDGRMETYGYEATEDGGLKTIVTHGTEAFPQGIAGKTTREITIENHLGRVTRTETQIRTDDGFARISWTENEYDNEGHVIVTRNSSGGRTESSWGCCHRDSYTDATGTSTDYLYDDLGRVMSASREGLKGEITTTYTYDAKGRRLTETVSAGGLTLQTENHYDTAGRLDYIIGQDGLKTSYAYSEDGLTTTVIRPGGGTEITTRFKDGRIKSVTGTAVPARYYAYGVEEDGSQWTRVSHGEQDGPMWETTWTDRLGRTVKAEKPGFDGVEITRHYYDAKGRLVRTETPGMADTLYVYNDAGEAFRTGLDVDGNRELVLGSADRITDSETLTKEVDGAWWQEATQIVYAEEGSDDATVVSTSRNRLTGLGVNLASESVTIDIHGNETVSKTVVDRGSDTVTQTVGSPFSDTDQVSESRYGLVVSSTSATGLTTTLDYDALGRRTQVTDPRTGTAVTHYNAKGRVDWVEDAAGFRQTFAYDPATGMKVAETNALKKTVRTAYNTRGQVTHTWGDATYPVAYTYDDQGRMKTMTTYRTEQGWSGEQFPESATGDLTTWHYHGATGLLSAKEDAQGKSTTYTYTAGGKLHTRTWAREKAGAQLTTTYAYDDATGELKTIDYSDDTPDITFDYDRLGRQESIRDAVGHRTFAYNEFLSLASETTSGLINQTVTRTYDAKGRSNGFALGSGYNITYGFADNGRFQTLAWNAGGHEDTVTYSRVDNSELVGGYTTANGFAATYAFEPERNLKTSVENTWDVAVISSYTYAYDEIGRRNSVKNSGAAFAEAAFTKWGYNDRNEVTESRRYKGADADDLSLPIDPETRLFAYDPIGNRKTATEGGPEAQQVLKSYVTNELNQYASITEGSVAESLGYDADGNMTSWNGNVMEWNGENRLVAFYPSAPVEGDMKFVFAYDYMGRRVKKVTQVYSGGAWGDEKATLFVYDGWNLVAETDGAGVVRKSYVWGLDLSQSLQGAGGVGGLVAEVMEGEAYYLAYDANGNVGQLVDGSGNIAARYEYDAFGKEILVEGEVADENAVRFSTKYRDEMGLVYYGYRYYVSELGRWGSRDPIGEEKSDNIYQGMKNSTVNKIDSKGLFDIPSNLSGLKKVYDSAWNDPRSFVINPYYPKCGPTPRDPTNYNPMPATYVSIEMHRYIGGGLLYIKCCDGCVEHRHTYMKVCNGTAKEVSISIGIASNTTGEACRKPPQKLVGPEKGGTIYGPLGFEAGATFGTKGEGASYSGGVGLSYSPLPVKATFCYYQLIESKGLGSCLKRR
ncbi:RHS repeat domain-containing protein [Desulfoluna butyratoxydans]|uniref:Rhs repeat n=1 Tax=Desulfoluna butyratoxydans TaxID=231438 RepID=A0A4U8YUQ9_9BACT|nr:RHS repeat-associated core domain-containing protein [Desulfoluna butyratoxydans]VFQ45093.1 rhs repeat [Desulfoluna butyratoxydans]